MRQAIMIEPGKIEFRNVPEPKVGAGEILLRVKRIGVCGSDIHVFHGCQPFTPYPVIQGHEVSGEAVEVGPNVSQIKVGDKVTVIPQVVCGKCYQCTHGKYHICDNLKVMGFQTTGMASEYFAVDAQSVLKLPENTSFDKGAMVEPLAVGVHGVGKGGSINGKNILVLGAGPIGNLVAQAAKHLGAREVMITDISNYRLNIAKTCGIDYCINPTTQELGEEIVDKFGPEKADLILDCAGVNETIDQAIKYARKGTDIIIISVFGDKAATDIAMLQDRELRLVGSLMYQKNDFEKAIELIGAGQVELDPLITIHFAFQDYPKAYQYIDENREKTMKVMIDM